MSTLPGPNGANSSFIDYKLSVTDAVVVFVGTSAMEGFDRVDLNVSSELDLAFGLRSASADPLKLSQLANSGDELIQYVAERHNDTIVVVNAPGPVDMSKWADHVNVTSIIFAYFPSPEGGNAIAGALWGDFSPSGKLPFTIAANVSDYADALYSGPVTINPVANFTEGTLIDYRYFDAKNITPKYEFGFGLSYTR